VYGFTVMPDDPLKNLPLSKIAHPLSRVLHFSRLSCIPLYCEFNATAHEKGIK
jgi:hypothetical protein